MIEKETKQALDESMGERMLAIGEIKTDNPIQSNIVRKIVYTQHYKN